MRRPSFPTVISLIALFVALGGTSYAVSKLPRNSVGSAQIKRNAVTSAKVRPRAIGRSDLAPSARIGQRGQRGPAGPPGAPGDAVAPEPWKPLALSGPWHNYGTGFPTGAYRKDARGRVYVTGVVAKDGDPASADVIATLPSEYRPSARTLFTTPTGSHTSGQVYGRIDVAANGEITWSRGQPARVST